ncbi:TetR/AcrR family transcriptional regulator [Shewanella gaetbuli]|uniref:TetR/AcrR family transcriptional regulator n=1 Tax=Shewanella gaetbuli TaxID=220752 RepID=A0A9X2CJ71_9GAMM|nr:TetR/AcrR family transcriptional regulator [Shewanella gaetbuli]MCL1141736.1 TetR/AcrR family transcriptional regulator [Shewanella gaetbuli]
MTTNMDVTLSKSEQKKVQILNSAIELFCSQGFPTTSMDEVAKHANVSKQTVYSHFGSKDDLFVAAIESRCVVHQLTQNLLEDSSNPEDALKTFALQFGNLIVSEEAITVFTTCVAQADTHPDVSALFYEAGPKHILHLLEVYLSEVNQQGEYFFDNPHDSAVRFTLMLFGELKMRLELGIPVDDLFAKRPQYLIDTATMFLKAHKL